MIHLITGGSGSGKSRYAEQQILELGEGRRIYLATMYPYDEESRQRIERHRAMRAEKNFETLECYTRLGELEIPEGCNVLLECMSNLVANEMFRPGAAGIHAVSAVRDGIRNLRRKAANLVIVTNEIFSDGVAYGNQTRVYQEYLGAINQELAHIADRVTEVIYGIPVPVKGELAGGGS
jgi:adenosylcobinamide kinase/adenosylcobinamide-phosphate guanylyltransferase